MPSESSLTIHAAVLHGGTFDGLVVHGPQGEPIQRQAPDGRKLTYVWGVPGHPRGAVRLRDGVVVRDYFLLVR